MNLFIRMKDMLNGERKKNRRPGLRQIFTSILTKTVIKPSTLAFWREGRNTPGYSLFDWLHGYVYARWTYIYIGSGAGEHWLKKLIKPIAGLYTQIYSQGDPELAGRSFADTYHGKVLPLDEAKQLVMINEPVTVRDLEQVIPYSQARGLILRHPEHIVALECPCRSSRSDPCLPLDVCLIVGEPFAAFVLEHHQDRSRAISQSEAAGILEAENERGHVHHAFFKDAMLGRFYAICNCCSCCCGAMSSWFHGVPMLASSGYVCQIDELLCAGCGECVDTCQFGALALEDDVATVDVSLCMGCGICTDRCIYGASELVRDPAKGEPLLVGELGIMA